VYIKSVVVPNCLKIATCQGKIFSPVSCSLSINDDIVSNVAFPERPHSIRISNLTNNITKTIHNNVNYLVGIGILETLEILSSLLVNHISFDHLEKFH
jgi:hypothetical protein